MIYTHFFFACIETSCLIISAKCLKNSQLSTTPLDALVDIVKVEKNSGQNF